MKTTKELARELGLLRRRSKSAGPVVKRSSANSQPYQYIVVIDFESTCWKDQKFRTQEIIEFPAVLLNTSSGECESEFHFYVQPCEQPVLSDFCRELTGITQGQVENGIPLSLCMKKFGHWIEKLNREKNVLFNPISEHPVKGTFLTWSDWDLGVCLQYECKRKQIMKPRYLNSWIDLRATYRNFYGRKPNGLNGALQDLGIEFSGRQHSGVDDARNTARLAWRMIRDGCVLSITKTVKESRTRSADSIPINQLFERREPKTESGEEKTAGNKPAVGSVQSNQLFKRPLPPNVSTAITPVLRSPSRKQRKMTPHIKDTFQNYNTASNTSSSTPAMDVHNDNARLSTETKITSNTGCVAFSIPKTLVPVQPRSPLQLSNNPMTECNTSTTALPVCSTVPLCRTSVSLCPSSTTSFTIPLHCGRTTTGASSTSTVSVCSTSTVAVPLQGTSRTTKSTGCKSSLPLYSTSGATVSVCSTPIMAVPLQDTSRTTKYLGCKSSLPLYSTSGATVSVCSTSTMVVPLLDTSRTTKSVGCKSSLPLYSTSGATVSVCSTSTVAVPLQDTSRTTKSLGCKSSLPLYSTSGATVSVCSTSTVAVPLQDTSRTTKSLGCKSSLPLYSTSGATVSVCSTSTMVVPLQDTSRITKSVGCKSSLPLYSTSGATVSVCSTSTVAVPLLDTSRTTKSLGCKSSLPLYSTSGATVSVCSTSTVAVPLQDTSRTTKSLGCKSSLPLYSTSGATVSGFSTSTEGVPLQDTSRTTKSVGCKSSLPLYSTSGATVSVCSTSTVAVPFQDTSRTTKSLVTKSSLPLYSTSGATVSVCSTSTTAVPLYSTSGATMCGTHSKSAMFMCSRSISTTVCCNKSAITSTNRIGISETNRGNFVQPDSISQVCLVRNARQEFGIRCNAGNDKENATLDQFVKTVSTNHVAPFTDTKTPGPLNKGALLQPPGVLRTPVKRFAPGGSSRNWSIADITPPLCLCGKRSKKRFVQSPGPNQGRCFYSCPSGRNPGGIQKKQIGCNFFKWESALTGRQTKFAPVPNRNAMSTGLIKRQVNKTGADANLNRSCNVDIKRPFKSTTTVHMR